MTQTAEFPWTALPRPLRPLARLGGMLVSPVRTLLALLRGAPAEPLEVVLLAVLVVMAAYPLSVGRYVMAAEVSVSLSLRRLFALDGLVCTRLVNQVIFCAVAAVGFLGVGVLRRRPVRVADAVAAGLYLYVPMAAVLLLGLALLRAGVDLPWLPHHPLDGAWVFEGRHFHPERVALKLAVEMSASIGMGLAAAWRWGQPGPASPPPR